eukprot:CAMPEP_0182507448 /NCGR_PEP_ID=MMETSP1321-20130603/23164_1 /TAXON_ID=91990 /ORGANISM="Bolidomonas sp., Strain RCC1657" /LENGTH=68 /DNA_ID=CAMNT_0024713349 /DNA_START=627 /DNA_END=833 /DNA_ORIENTATION=-
MPPAPWTMGSMTNAAMESPWALSFSDRSMHSGSSVGFLQKTCLGRTLSKAECMPFTGSQTLMAPNVSP